MHFRREQLHQMVGSSEPMLTLAIRNQVQQEHASVVDGLPLDLLDEMIDGSLRAAREYGLKAPPHLATFVLWCFEFGPEFHRHPAIRAILAAPDIPPEEKIATVLQRTPEEVWRACEGAIHRMTWFPELRAPVER
jgi:hypothetical protein